MPRHKQPVEVAKLKGADRKNPQRYTREVPKSDQALGQIPEWLTPLAQSIWFEIEAYAPKGVLTAADRRMLASLCELLAEFQEEPRKMPAARIGHMIGLMGRFGMSPADRQRVGAEKPNKDEDDFSDF